MKASRSSIAIVDDDPVVLETLGDYLARIPEFASPLLFLSPKEAEPTLRRRRLDVVLVDLHLPGDSGVRYLGRLRRSGRVPNLIVYTASEDPELVVEAFRAGATGYIHKSCSLAEIVRRLIQLREGEPAIDSRTRGWLFDTSQGVLAKSAIPTLGPMETKVMQLTRDGLSCGEIAKSLGCSVHTVYMHNRRIGRKLGTQGRLAASRMTASSSVPPAPGSGD